MNAQSPAPAARPLPLKPKWIAVGLFLLVTYLLLRPWLVERYGWDLPGFTNVASKSGASTPDKTTSQRPRIEKNRPVEVPVAPEQGEPVIEGEEQDKQVASTHSQPTDNSLPTNAPKATAPEVAPQPRTTSETEPDKPATSPVAKSSSKPATTPGPTQANSSKSPTNSPSAKPQAAAPKPGWKGLKSIGRGKFESPAGLVYDQYRIDHVMEHTEDNTDKPSHGVFDVTTQDEVLAIVDEAFDLTKKRGPPQVVTEDEGDRTAYTVNLNRKVGRAGGQSGARRRNPPLQKIKIVVEDTRVITAFPTN